jgi:hypothetical protein
LFLLEVVEWARVFLRVVSAQLGQEFTELRILLLLKLLVICSGLFLRIEYGNLPVIDILEGGVQVRISAEEVEGFRELVCRVRESIAVMMRLRQAGEVHPGGQRMPDVLVECRITSLGLGSGQCIGGNYEKRFTVCLLELQIQPFADLCSLTFEEELSDVEVLGVECIREAELFTCDYLRLEVGPVHRSYGEVEAAPVNFVAGKDLPKSPDKLRFTGRGNTVDPDHLTLAFPLHCIVQQPTHRSEGISVPGIVHFP